MNPWPLPPPSPPHSGDGGGCLLGRACARSGWGRLRPSDTPREGSGHQTASAPCHTPGKTTQHVGEDKSARRFYGSALRKNNSALRSWAVSDGSSGCGASDTSGRRHSGVDRRRLRERSPGRRSVLCGCSRLTHSGMKAPWPHPPLPPFTTTPTVAEGSCRGRSDSG